MKNKYFVILLLLFFLSSSVNAQYPKYEGFNPYPRLLVQEKQIYRLEFPQKESIKLWHPAHSIKLDWGDQAIRLYGTAEDPYCIAPSFSALGVDTNSFVGPLVLKIRLRSHDIKSLEVFWSEKNEPGFFPHHSSTEDVVKSDQWNECIINIDPKSPLLQLRFDPGSGKGLTEIQSIEIYKIYYLPLEIRDWEVRNGQLDLTVVNNSDSPIQAKITAEDQIKTLNFNVQEEKKIVLSFPKRKTFETMAVHLEVPALHAQISRLFHACHSAIELNGPVLENSAMKVRFAKDGSGALIYRDGKLSTAIFPLIQNNQGAGQILFANKFNEIPQPGKNMVLSEMIPAAQDSRSKQVFSFSMTGDSTTGGSRKKGVIQFSLLDNELQFQLRSEEPVLGPVIRPEGVMCQAIFPGVEYLEKGEHSSSLADIETSEHLRYAPPLFHVTFPLLAIITDKVACTLTYSSPKTQPIFAVPDFIDRTVITGNGEATKGGWFRVHRMGLYGTEMKGSITITAPKSLESIILQEVVKRGLPPLPPLPRTEEEQDQLNFAGLNQSTLKTKTGWVHATSGESGYGPFKPGWGSDFISTWLEITGEMPKVPSMTLGGGHIANLSVWFRTCQSEVLLKIKNQQARIQQKSLRSDGSVPYSGKYLKGHWTDSSSGHTANTLFILGLHWYLTGELESLDALERGLKYVNQERTPRGAQVWELSLHTPDIMGSSRAVLANVFAYKGTGKEEYLNQARRWAITGLPFVYLWDLEDQPSNKTVGRYATIAVFGATNWIAPNWMGRPVQWCGLDYAYALLELAPLDKTMDWKKIAEGIIISGEQQQYTEGISIGLLPDSFNLIPQTRNIYDIHPCTLHMLHRKIRNEITDVNVFIDPKSKSRIVSPYPVIFKNGSTILQGKSGTSCQIWVNGQVRNVKCNEPIEL